MRGFKFWLLAVVGLLGITMLIGFGWLRSSLPQLDGTITLTGPKNEITVARDAHGIPHIGAADEDDLFFAMGFVHAQDRLWQMEVNRRIGAGRVAEILGESGIGFDRYFRTLGFADRAASAWEKLDDRTREVLEIYADGVNAYLKTHTGALPPEFIMTGTTPEPWSPLDTLVWQKMMWLSLSGNMRQELARARLLQQLTPEKLHTIYPTYPGDTEPPFPSFDALYGLELEETMAMMGGEPEAVIGSNNWVVSGDRTRSGKPLLANDPHLGLTTPSIWYMVRLHNRSTGNNLVGASFPGSPSIVLGRNDKIAWGFTNTAPDIQDLFIEKLVNDGQQYLTPDGPADFKIRNELIKVKGGEDILLEVRETRHGPVMTDALGDQTDFMRNGYVLALQWTALMEKDTAVTGLLALAHAKDFKDFKAAGQYYFGPEQNMIYADTDGNIGYYAPALVPIRHPENEIMGRLPSPGWIAKYDWQGFVPYDQLPERFNPETGIIATANEKIVANDYPYFITRDWSLPYRGNRIRAELKAAPKHDLASFAKLQADQVSDLAREITPLLVGALRGSEDHTELAETLANWDGSMAPDRPEPLIFYSWLRIYQEALMADELGDVYDDFRRIRERLIKSTLFWSNIPQTKIAPPYYALPAINKEGALAWCDDISTEGTMETCDTLARTAFTTTIKQLTAQHGDNWKTWQWGDQHILTQTHRPMSQIPVIKNIFEISSPIGGSTHTVNVSGVSQDRERLHQSTFGPSYRGIFDLSDLDQSLYAHPAGQSGNPLSPHYSDLFPLWRDGLYFTIPTDKAVPEKAAHIMTLVPMPQVN